MALVTFTRRERTMSVHADAIGESPVGEVVLVVLLAGGGKHEIVLDPDEVVEIREGKTMRAHCFCCWSDCIWMHPDGIRVCDEHAVGEGPFRPLDDDEMWDKGPRD